MPTSFVIDPPPAFSPRADWVAHEQRVSALLRDYPNDPGLIAARREARATLRALPDATVI